MKQVINLVAFLLILSTLSAQQPVSWRYTAKKISEKTYEVSITATLQQGWHIYAQQQPDEALIIPTKIEFNKNPLYTLSGSTKEVGKIEKYKDPLGSDVYRYTGEVNFIQIVKLKDKAKSVLAGNITYQACTDEKCLMPKTINFDIPVTE